MCQAWFWSAWDSPFFPPLWLGVTHWSPLWNFGEAASSWLLFIVHCSHTENCRSSNMFQQSSNSSRRGRAVIENGSLPRPACLHRPHSFLVAAPSDGFILACSYSLLFCGPSTTNPLRSENLLYVPPWAWLWRDPKEQVRVSPCSHWLAS